MPRRPQRTLLSLAALGAICVAACPARAQNAPALQDPVATAATTPSDASDEVAALQRQALLDHAPTYPNLLVPQPGAVRVDFENVSARVMLLRPTTLRHFADHYQGVAYPYTITDTQRLCATPCTLFIPPGATDLRVSSFAQRGADEVLHFVTPIDGARVRIRGGDEGYALASGFVGTFGAMTGLAGLIGMLLQSGAPDPDPVAQAETMWILGGIALGGSALVGSAVALAETSTTAVVRVAPLRPRRPRVAFGGAVVAPDAAARGGHVAVALTF